MGNKKRQHNECGHFGIHVARGLCQKCYTRVWRINHPESSAATLRKNRLRPYKLSQEQFDGMLAFQRGRCMLCLREFKSTRDTHVDHDHTTGVVRGLLCFSCNKALGMLGDNETAMRRAVAYMRGEPMFMPKPSEQMLGRAGLSEWQPPRFIQRHMTV